MVTLSGASGTIYVGTVWGEESTEPDLLSHPDLGASLFPVMEGDQMVGVISATETIRLAAHSLVVSKSREDLTLAPIKLGPGVLGKIVDVAEATSIKLKALYPLGRLKRQTNKCGPRPPVTFRFHAVAVQNIIIAIEPEGIRISEPSGRLTLRLTG